MRICILGAGSLGSTIGGRLAQAGNDVTLINIDPAYIDAVETHGLVLNEAGQSDRIAVKAASSTEGMAPVDLLIVLVKSAATEVAMRAATNLVGPGTVVMSLQNGVGHEDVLSDIVGAGQVIAGKTYVGGVLTAPGVVSCGTKGKETIIGELSGEVSGRARRIAGTMTAAGLCTEVSGNIRGVIWDKLMINVATGALSGITRLNYGNLYDVPEVAETAIAAVAETMAVAAALGVKLSMKHPREAWDKAAAGLPFTFKASILQSLEAGRPTEVDYINGAVVRAGKAVGVATPVNATLVACIKGVERSLDPKAAA